MTTIQQTQTYGVLIPEADTGANGCSAHDLHMPLAQAINAVRQHGSAQLLCNGSDRMNDKGNENLVNAFFRDALDTIQLPGETIEFEVKIGKVSKLIVVTLSKKL